LPVKVFHLPGKNSSVVASLLRALGQSSEGQYVVLADGNVRAGEVKNALLARVDSELIDPEERQRVIQILNSDQFVVRDARELRQGSKISLARVLDVVKKTWPTLVTVGIFTSDANAFLVDADREELISWALYENMILVSKAVEAAKAIKAIKAFILQQA